LPTECIIALLLYAQNVNKDGADISAAYCNIIIVIVYIAAEYNINNKVGI